VKVPSGDWEEYQQLLPANISQVLIFGFFGAQYCRYGFLSFPFYFFLTILAIFFGKDRYLRISGYRRHSKNTSLQLDILVVSFHIFRWVLNGAGSAIFLQSSRRVYPISLLFFFFPFSFRKTSLKWPN